MNGDDAAMGDAADDAGNGITAVVTAGR